MLSYLAKVMKAAYKAATAKDETVRSNFRGKGMGKRSRSRRTQVRRRALGVGVRGLAVGVRSALLNVGLPYALISLRPCASRAQMGHHRCALLSALEGFQGRVDARTRTESSDFLVAWVRQLRSLRFRFLHSQLFRNTQLHHV